MSITKRQVSLLHVAKAKLCLDDEAYRNILENEAGVTTSTALTPEKFEIVLQHFKRLGFQQAKSTGNCLGYRPNMATPAQVDYILDLWRQYVGRRDEKTINHWLHRCFGISALRFADFSTAGKAIIALKSMSKRKKQHG